MVKKMNKTNLIETLKKQLNIDENKAIIINNILENNNIIGKKNKRKNNNWTYEKIKHKQ